MDGRPTGTPPPDSLRAAWSGHLRDQRRVVLNLRHLTLLQTPKTGQNDTILGVLFVQMHKEGVVDALHAGELAAPAGVEPATNCLSGSGFNQVSCGTSFLPGLLLWRT